MSLNSVKIPPHGTMGWIQGYQKQFRGWGGVRCRVLVVFWTNTFSARFSNEGSKSNDLAELRWAKAHSFWNSHRPEDRQGESPMAYVSAEPTYAQFQVVKNRISDSDLEITILLGTQWEILQITFSLLWYVWLESSGSLVTDTPRRQ